MDSLKNFQEMENRMKELQNEVDNLNSAVYKYAKENQGLEAQNREYAKLLTKFTLLTKLCRTESEFHEQFANACGEVVDLLEESEGVE